MPLASGAQAAPKAKRDAAESVFSAVLKKTALEAEQPAAHTKAAGRDKDNPQQPAPTQQDGNRAAAIALVHMQTPVQADTRPWTLSLPKQEKKEAAAETTIDRAPTAAEEKPTPVVNAAAVEKPLAFGVTVQKQGADSKPAAALPAANPFEKTSGDSKSSGSKQHADSKGSGEQQPPAIPKMAEAATASPTGAPLAPSPANAVQTAPATAVTQAYAATPKPVVSTPAVARTAEIAEPPSTPASKPQSITFSAGSGENEVSVRVSERAGDVQVTVRTADADLATSLRQHIPELSDRLSQTGVAAEIWSAHGVASAQANGGGDEFTEQNAFANYGENAQQQQRRSHPGSDADGADGENQ